MNNQDKVILDLCGGTGAWSKPYKDAGYNVMNITLPDYNVRTYLANIKRKQFLHPFWEDIQPYGILAAPPCTMFSLARTKAKNPRDLKEGMKTVRGCLNIIWSYMEIQQDTRKKTLPLKFWALENPNGMLKYFLGKPAFEFDPWEFGDMWKKKTHIWGWFNEPKRKIIKKPDLPKFGSDKPIEFRFNRKKKAITPQGFAKAFYEANK